MVGNPEVQPNPGSPVVRLDKVTKRFGEGPLSVTALEDISLQINRGDFVAFAGPSGSGKSTLLSIIAGLERPTSGDVFIDGAPLAAMTDKTLSLWRGRNVGLMFQSHNLIPVLNSYHNVALPLVLSTTPRKTWKARALAALDQVSLSERVNHYPNQLSQGEGQRVAIARSIVHDPVIIILDEPTGNLDRENADGILELLSQFNREFGRTIIMVTHDPKATEHATRIFELDKGVLR